MFYTVYKGFFCSEPEVRNFDTEAEAKAYYDSIDIDHYYKFNVYRDPKMKLHKAHKTITCTVDGEESFIDEEYGEIRR